VTSPFIHLHTHSEFSLADSIVRIGELVDATVAQKTPAVALTDSVNLFALVKFYRKAVSAGIKPIIGADVWIENVQDANKPFKLVLLCKNREGYGDLCVLISRAYTEGQHSGRPCIKKEWLQYKGSGLIALSGAEHGEIGRALLAKKYDQAEVLAKEYQQWFPQSFYLELQRIGQPNQDEYIRLAMRLAEKQQLPVVATNFVHFMHADDFEAHETRVCIQDGRVLGDTRRPKRFTEQQYFRSPNEMCELFADIPEAIENTVEIAKRCNLTLEFDKYYLPDYPLANNSDLNKVMADQSKQGLDHYLNKHPEITQRDAYYERLEQELGVISKMGFAGYFLIVADFIQWAKQNDVPVGPGRGSGAGSLVAFALSITALDPIEYDLLFERFLNPERVSLPDFDIDFCIEGRDRVIEYVTEKYGKDKVSQIITYGTMAAKAVVRDVGRVMDHPYGFVDKLAKLVPFEVGITLKKALAQEPILKERYEQEEDVKELLDTAMVLEGIARNAGKHAGGVVIAPTALTDFMPMYCEQGSTQLVTQLDKDDLESLGLVKFDFLGLRNLTIIDKAVKMVNAQRAIEKQEPLDIEQLPIDDADTFTLFKECKTTALFQLESRGMKDLIKRLQPDSFEEIIALVALFRPGPLQSGMVDDFIDRKHKRKAVEYPHPSLEAILLPTYGVILYQEQVMQIAQVLSGYSLGKADLLRRAMGKKKPEEMAKLRDGFVAGAVERGVKEKTAKYIFDQIEKFAGYGFNRSHSAAYALIAYQTAWLKTHYPAPFMAAVLSSDMDNTDKVVTMLAECRDMGINILPPDVNHCEYNFIPCNENTIYYGLGAIKGLGQAVIDAIRQVRVEGGEYTDLFDFCKRMGPHKLNKRAMESLIRSGAMDVLASNRATLMASLAKALQYADQVGRNKQTGQHDIFGTVEVGGEDHAYVEATDWADEERLNGEKETLGLYLTGHPIERYEEELSHIVDASISELKPTANRSLVIAGLIVAIRTMQTRRGDRMAFITLDDRTGRLELAIFSDIFHSCRHLLTKDTLLVVSGQVSVDDYTDGFKMSADKLYSIAEAREVYARRLVIDVDDALAGNGFVGSLKEILSSELNGQCPVFLNYAGQQASAEIALGEEWRINPTDAIIDRLYNLAGKQHVHVVYQ
jgi:DNA polymerase-3 subunit alpha